MSGGLIDTPIFSMLKSRMDMLGERQRVLAQNVANVSTPGYKPRDVDKEAFDAALARGEAGGGRGGRGGVAMAVTRAGHMAPAMSSAPGVKVKSSPDSETTLDGNAVVVEEQMMKMAQTRMEFETAVQLYSKGLALVRMAAKGPGQ